ncbi:MAG TPA: hypothetical protein PKY81_06315 [bacterium]|nr:hypothetical protein [bacterium]HPN30554.1 hypothetical protein [bacterium]
MLKKIIALCLIAILALSFALVGCSKQEEQPAAEAPAATEAAPAETPAPAAEAPATEAAPAPAAPAAEAAPAAPAGN